jgi:hypothetical protein
VLPFMLAHALALSLRIGGTDAARRKLVFAASAAAFLGAVLPGAMMVASRALDYTPLIEGGPAAREMTQWYTTAHRPRARALATRHAAVLHGLARVGTATPVDARVMWVRPEYVALLSGRHAQPVLVSWSPDQLREAIQASGTTHVALASLFKTDIEGNRRDPQPLMSTARQYATPEYAVRNPVVDTEDFVLLRVKRD